jgi:hypothetical protein
MRRIVFYEMHQISIVKERKEQKSKLQRLVPFKGRRE